MAVRKETVMDASYLLIALRTIRDTPTGTVPWQYGEALDWIIEHIDQNYYHFEDILDNERDEQ
jgi:hypothetical protein